MHSIFYSIQEGDGKMNKLLLVLSLLVSCSAFAVQPSEVCMSMSFDSGKNKCIKIINQGYISSGAADVCLRQSFDSGKIDCLSASLNKEYSNSELRLCNSQSFDSGTTKCMQNAGRFVGRDDDSDHDYDRGKMRRIVRLARQAQRHLDNRNWSRVYDVLDQIIRLARDR